MVTIKQSRFFVMVLITSLTFIFLVTKLPAITFNFTRYGDYFLPIIAVLFTSFTLLGATLNLKKLFPILLIAVFLSPLSNVTDSGWYNVPSTGLLFGTLFQFRPRQIKLERKHYYLFGAIILLGFYYNFIPFISSESNGSNDKLWLYNFSTFLRYIYIALLLIQIQPSTEKLFKYCNWFAIFFASFVILEAIHIPLINIAMKTVSQIGYRPLEISHDIALNYFRASGLAIDANHAAIRLAILLPIALYQFKTFKYSLLVIAFIIVGIYLTGSRSGLVLALSATSLWFLYDKQWLVKFKFLSKTIVIASVFITLGLFNSSFEKVAEIAMGRYLLFISSERQSTDVSFLFRQTELLQAITDLTPFGNRTDTLATVHSELGRLIRFYGALGIIVTVFFWSFYLLLMRKNYIAFSIVLMMFLNSFWKWTFHIEAFFIPAIVVSTIYISSLRTVDKNEPSNSHLHV